jgi:hypothetical protein
MQCIDVFGNTLVHVFVVRFFGDGEFNEQSHDNEADQVRKSF